MTSAPVWMCRLTDAFFNDPEAVKTTYVIPLVMTGQKGFGKIYTGTLKEGLTGLENQSVSVGCCS